MSICPADPKPRIRGMAVRSWEPDEIGVVSCMECGAESERFFKCPCTGRDCTHLWLCWECHRDGA